MFGSCVFGTLFFIIFIKKEKNNNKTEWVDYSPIQ